MLPTYEELEMKSHIYIAERGVLIKEIQDINGEPDSLSKSKRISNRLERLKVLNHRIERLGKKYNIVKVWGKYLIKTSKHLAVPKDFTIYYTDISTQDARVLTELTFPDGLAEFHTEVIPVGEIIEQRYKPPSINYTIPENK